MRRIHRIVFLITLAAALPALSGCADFDADKLDIFGLNEKKKLPGERKAIFPEGVPGVTQGIPPEYIRGNQPAPETAQAIPVEPEKPAAKLNNKPAKKTAAFTQDEKPKVKRQPKPRPASAQQQQAPAGQQQQPAPWPEQAPAQSSSSGSAPWPSAPAPGTFSR